MSENLKDLVSKLKANGKVVGLVKLMSPHDVVAVLAKKMELCDKDAKFVTNNLLQHIEREGLAGPAIETNKQYPVPPSIRRDNEVEESYINNLGALVPTIKRYEFPPDPIEKPNGWPYDAMTKAAMDPHNKGRKRGLMTARKRSGKVVREREKNPFDPNFELDQPGIAGKGIYQKSSPHARDNSMPTSGASWDEKGTPGWSSSPPGKGFDLPDEDNLNFMKPSPVGSPAPQFFGGRNPGRRMGFRRR